LHFTGSELVRDIVIGVSDGLTVPFALAVGLSDAVESSGIISEKNEKRSRCPIERPPKCPDDLVGLHRGRSGSFGGFPDRERVGVWRRHVHVLVVNKESTMPAILFLAGHARVEQSRESRSAGLATAGGGP